MFGYCRDEYQTSCQIPLGSETSVAVHRRQTARPRSAQSFFCFALVSQRVFEVRLLAMQRRHGLGVFSCDAHQVFSNASADALFGTLTGISIRVTSVLKNESLKADWNLNAENTGIFANVWKRVFFERRYRRYPWTVKLDVDAVFLPDQLRHVLLRHCRTPCGAVHFRQNYTSLRPWSLIHMLPLLNEGWSAMFGPLMVFSRDALLRLAEFFAVCKKEVVNREHPEIWGDHWSLHEDVFVDRCLSRLDVTAIVEHRLLREGRLAPPPDDSFAVPKRFPRACLQGYVGHHPYKQEDRYLRCQSQAAMREYRVAKGRLHRCSLYGTSGLPSAYQAAELVRPSDPLGFAPRGFPPGCPRPPSAAFAIAERLALQRWRWQALGRAGPQWKVRQPGHA